mgnify:CR=1 FL=1
MICRHPTQGQKLDVAGLNEITVLIDRSETELTEVAMNSWSPGLDGPPHAHDQKEQNFLVTSGRGEVVIGADRFPAAPGDLFYVPAGVVHQTINLNKDQRLVYFLFNAFLDAGKEGHASFADHIAKVKHVRRQQADEQKAGVPGGTAPGTRRRGAKSVLPGPGPAATTLIKRSETTRCEALAWHLAAGSGATIPADAHKEQTLFVHSGTGTIQIGTERAEVKAHHTLLVPRGTAGALAAGAEGLQVVSFGTVITP